jgi:hypothetical protein
LKRVLFDHNVPSPLRRLLKVCDVAFADDMGWSLLENGELLDAAEKAGFDVLLSGDKTIRHEQNMAGRKIALVYMSDNHWPIVEPYAPAIAEAIDQVNPGEVKPVYCGTFVPRWHRYRSP